MSADEPTESAAKPVAGERVQHGTGVTSTRAFPTSASPDHLDPFVLFEQFYIDPTAGFPMHPHRGFEIVSYMLDGGMVHEDSLGVANTAREDDAMCITTGSGIRHSEFPADGEACTGLQLWVNLPRDRKDADPGYADATAAELPTRSVDGATVTAVVGADSPLGLETPVEYHDVTVTDAWTWSPPTGWAGFLYAVDGEGTVDDAPLSAGEVVPLPDGGTVDVAASDCVRVVAVAGHPHDEPIDQRGPFVC